MDKNLSEYSAFVTDIHTLYARYFDTWDLAWRSYVGSEEYKQGRYLKMFESDRQTGSEVISTYSVDEFGNTTGKHRAKVDNTSGFNRAAAVAGNDDGGSYYNEKINNVSFYNYVKLIVNEYNSILFKNPAHRILSETEQMDSFRENVDGKGNSLSEFFSEVDTLVSIFGVSWLSVVKPSGSDTPRFSVYKPLDVTNWEFGFDVNGDQVLKKLVVKVAEDENQLVFRLFTPETIETVFTSQDEDYLPPELEGLFEEDEGVYRVVQENELGYIPVFPIYQGIQIFPGVGSSPVLDASIIQREIYNLNSEIYSSVNYSIHPTLVVDEQTDELNNGEIGAEAGSIVRVSSGLQGEQNYTYEFRQPNTDPITEIRDLIDNKIEKMLETCMIRSDDLIKSSSSAAMVEVLDTKLQAFVRKKAIQMENAEKRAFDIYHDWTNQINESAVSYSRQYNNRAMEHELKELSMLMDLADRVSANDQLPELELYDTPEQAEAVAIAMGGSGSHEHTADSGTVQYMPFTTHDEYEKLMRAGNGDQQTMRDKLRDRLEQLLDTSTTSNSQ
jgi:hypothetical protein|tara:strand:+ start:61 stop:1728 length:1668 start_codon:yes stop_codon:yes gene_type:complete